MMPEMDGFEVLKKLRKESEVPVLMLTALGEETDRIVGLEMGADDYLAAAACLVRADRVANGGPARLDEQDTEMGGGKGDTGKGKESNSLDYVALDADAGQQPVEHPAAQTAEDVWRMGFAY